MRIFDENCRSIASSDSLRERITRKYLHWETHARSIIFTTITCYVITSLIGFLFFFFWNHNWVEFIRVKVRFTYCLFTRERFDSVFRTMPCNEFNVAEQRHDPYPRSLNIFFLIECSFCSQRLKISTMVFLKHIISIYELIILRYTIKNDDTRCDVHYRIESCKIFFQILNSFFANNPCDYRDLLFLYYFQLCITNDQMTRCERAQARNDRETQARVVEMVEKLGSRGTQMTHLHEVSLLFPDISLSRHLLRSMPFTDSPSTFPSLYPYSIYLSTFTRFKELELV